MTWISLCLLVLSVLTVQIQAASQGDPPDSLRLWYRRPAEKWTEALPIGNGRLGAMVHGGIEREHLQLNEDTLWSGGPHCYDNPDAYQYLAEARQAIERGKFKEAEKIAQRMLGRHKYQQAYLPLGDLFLDFPKGQKPSDCRRELNLQNAVSTVAYRIGNTRFTRRVFASHPDQCIAMRLECDRPGRITFDLSMTSAHASKSQATSNDTLTVTGHLEPRKEARLIAPWEEDGLSFAARVKVAAEGGRVVAQGDRVSVRDADAVTLVYVAATSYVNCRDVSGAPSAKVDGYLASVRGKSFEQLYQRHIDDHSRLFGRVSIDLGGNGMKENVPTDERLKRVREGSADPLLAEQVFQYGR